MGVKTVKFRPELARGIDLDSCAHLPLFKVFYNALRLGKTGVKVMLSPSYQGFHITCNEGFTKHEAEILGDCKGRIRYWEAQGYTFTFNSRHNKRGTIVGREEEYDPMRFAFWRVPQ